MFYQTFIYTGIIHILSLFLCSLKTQNDNSNKGNKWTLFRNRVLKIEHACQFAKLKIFL